MFLSISDQIYYLYECYAIFFIKNDLIKWLLPLNFNINIKYLIFFNY